MPAPTPPTPIDAVPATPDRNEGEIIFVPKMYTFLDYFAPFKAYLQLVVTYCADAVTWIGVQLGLAETAASSASNSVVENTALTAAYVARHQGAHTTAPTTRNGGSPLQDQDLFVYTGTTGGGYTNGLTYIWSSGSSTWGVFTVPGINVPKFQIITANTTWTKSAKFIEGSMRISGIGGGASGCSSNDGAKSGANSGEAVYRMPLDVSAISSASVVIGTGGVSVNGGGVNTAGNAGTATTFGALLTLAGAAATPVTGRAATVGGAFGGVQNASGGPQFMAQSLEIAIAGNAGMVSAPGAASAPNGAGGIIINDSGTKAGDVASGTLSAGGIGFGSGGGSSTNTVASGAGANGVLVLEWEETR